MPLEIERKFLVRQTDFLAGIKGSKIVQAYFSTGNKATIRVRIAGPAAYLTIKSKSKGRVRKEFEYAIPVADAQDMIENLCMKPAIEKIRYKVSHDEFTWEIDVFSGDNEGLVVAEIELDHENRDFPKPVWLGNEVTVDKRYRNSRLVSDPYKNWKK